MHWLARRLQHIHVLAEQPAAALPPKANATRGAAAQNLLHELRALVAEIAERDGVSACFACHEGLVVDSAGNAPDFEALSAMTQRCATSCVEAGAVLALGAVQHLVVIGSEKKLAVFSLGPLTLGILCPTEVELGRSLAER
ncbi:MAG: hypothetical protein ACK4N5_05475 [Myxococcales bacterium]